MGPRGWASFWTILATIAGVVGAAASVYPLLYSEQHALHITFPDWLDEPDFVRVESLSDPIFLTGNWFIKGGQWWNATTLRTGDAVSHHEGLKGLRVTANERRQVSIDVRTLESWVGRSLKKCVLSEFEIGIEYKSKTGTSWAYTDLPFCVSSSDMTNALWPKKWPSPLDTAPDPMRAPALPKELRR